jgi:alanine racemase
MIGVKSDGDHIIQQVITDTRKISSPEHSIFFALKGNFRDGHEFIRDAYDQGVRSFVVEKGTGERFDDAYFIEVDDSFAALQKLATLHRRRFNYPIIGITGSSGKTTVKEFLAQILSEGMVVARSPKSYNSQLGVAISLLELHDNADVGIIEAGISQPGEMETLERMIQPSVGILTNIGSAHSENFPSKEAILKEKCKLFSNVNELIVHSDIENIPVELKSKAHFVDATAFPNLEQSALSKVLKEDMSLAISAAMLMGMTQSECESSANKIKPLALRSETFEGINNALIINDTYSIDDEALQSALEFQKSIADNRRRIVIIGTDDPVKRKRVESFCHDFSDVELFFVKNTSEPLMDVSDSIVLIKGDRNFSMERYARRYRKHKHETYMEIDLGKIRSNITILKENIPNTTKVLAMVKASSYGSGGEKLGQFLEQLGLDYLGVAYPNEGVDLRKSGVRIPILVMNTDPGSIEDCVKYDLEPAVHSMHQLDELIKELIYLQTDRLPIHIKLETGMNRLGFTEDDIPRLAALINAQPEVSVRSVYSHLASSDELHSPFVHQQAKRFNQMTDELKECLTGPFICHLLNSEGVVNFQEYHFDMVRIGIGMYGITENKKLSGKLQEAVRLFSTVSAVKNVKANEPIGYGCKGKLDTDGTIAIVPIGYADGFRRSLSLGKGSVYMHGKKCPVVGMVCMDMIMVDVTGLGINAGDSVEIIGPNQTLGELATVMETIPYEVLTGISQRVQRVYLED